MDDSINNIGFYAIYAIFIGSLQTNIADKDEKIDWRIGAKDIGTIL